MRNVLAVVLLLATCNGTAAQSAAAPSVAHFHHVHLNATDPAAAILFYTSRFKARQESFAGLGDALWTGDSWLLFTKVAAPPPSEVLSGIWHIGWGAEDMQSTYQQQLAKGTRFATPLTDISDMVGGNRAFYYAYVDGPDHVLVELNTARHHNFGHVHMFSADPPAAFVTADHVSMIIYPVEYLQTAAPQTWQARGGAFVSTRGRVVDHLGFSVDDLDATLARMRSEGVKITAEPRSLADGRIRLAFIEGPDQVAIELLQDATPRPLPVSHGE